MDLRRPTLLDRAWRLALRTAYPLAKLWWRLRQRQQEGALLVISAGGALLLIRSSYRAGWSFPGGGLHAGETAAQAAVREAREEIGLHVEIAGAPTVLDGRWERWPDRVHFFDVALPGPVPVRIDNREVIDARWVPLGELTGYRFTRPVAELLRSRGLLGRAEHEHA